LRPLPLRMTVEGERQPSEDAFWRVETADATALQLKNLSTDHVLTLGYDNVREFRTPDFLILQCQIILKGNQAIIEPRVIVSANRTLEGFEALLSGSWKKEHIQHREIWMCESDNDFQIEIGDNDEPFSEPWTHGFPDKKHCAKCSVFLRIGSTAIKELAFVYCDGYRIFVPMPDAEIRDEARHFYYQRNSLKYKVGLVVGQDQFYIYRTLDGVANHCGIEVRN
jgi:hypothetical protein